MNIDLLQTLIRSVLKIGAGALMAKGYGDSTEWEMITAGILAGISVLWGAYHRTATPTPKE